jgi:hypothetical protein
LSLREGSVESTHNLEFAKGSVESTHKVPTDQPLPHEFAERVS